MGLKTDKVSMGETVCAVLRSAATGELKKIEEAKYKIEVIVTNLRTGEVTKREVKR